jgi:rod shape-determining protein MreD
VIGPTQWIFLPALAVMAVTLLLATPVKLFGWFPLPEVVLPLTLAFAWPLIRPSVLGPITLLLLGLFLDLLWGGPMGLWPICLLVVYGGVLLSRSFLAGQETRVLFAWYAVCTAGAFALAYLVVSLRSHNAPSILALLGQVIPTLLLFPIAAWMIERFDDGDLRFR